MTPLPRSVGDLTISVVAYHPNIPELLATFHSLARSLVRAHDNGTVQTVAFDLIDNGSPEGALELILANSELSKLPWVRTGIIRGHGNVGYGRGHNLSLLEAQSRYHLILNPDVTLAATTISEAITFLSVHPDVVMLSPEVKDENGVKQYLCRDDPSVLVLYLRSFAPTALRKRFQRLLDDYELRERLDSGASVQVPLATGCFMFGRTSEFQRVSGFSHSYFLYFEDYDLSKRLSARGRIMYVPDVTISHYGGHSSRKGWRHIRLFVRSAYTFFGSYGWRFI